MAEKPTGGSSDGDMRVGRDIDLSHAGNVIGIEALTQLFDKMYKKVDILGAIVKDSQKQVERLFEKVDMLSEKVDVMSSIAGSTVGDGVGVGDDDDDAALIDKKGKKPAVKKDKTKSVIFPDGIVATVANMKSGGLWLSAIPSEAADGFVSWAKAETNDNPILKSIEPEFASFKTNCVLDRVEIESTDKKSKDVVIAGIWKLGKETIKKRKDDDSKFFPIVFCKIKDSGSDSTVAVSMTEADWKLFKLAEFVQNNKLPSI